MILIAENMTNAKLAYCVQTIAFGLNAGEAFIQLEAVPESF